MRFTFVNLFLVFNLVSADVHSSDFSGQRKRRQLNSERQDHEGSKTEFHQRRASDDINVEQWGRWLQQDLSMPTTAPIDTNTQQPTNAPIQSPLPPTRIPVAPIIPPLPVTLSPATLTPIRVPTTVPVKAPTTAPLKAPIIAPIKVPTLAPLKAPTLAPLKAPTLAPLKAPTAAPKTSAPTSKAPTQAPVQPPISSDQTILRLVQSTPELSTLLTAITTSDENRIIPPFLIPLLNSTSTSLTLFAPVNSGFSRLAEIVPGYLTRLLTPEFGLHLLEILAHHATSGIVPSSSFPRTNLQMLAGGTVNITTSSNTSAVKSFSPVLATIIPPQNIRASNGLVHIVNNVLLPEFVFLNLIEGVRYANARNDGQFSTLLRLITAAGLESALAGVSGVTLVAPINSGISTETERFLLLPGNEAILSDVLRYHVLTVMFNFAAQAETNVTLVDTLLQGSRVVVGVIPMAGGSTFVRFNQAVQLSYWLSKENIIYTVDRLLIPPSLDNVIPGGITANSTAVSSNDQPVEESLTGSTKPAKKKQMKRSQIR